MPRLTQQDLLPVLEKIREIYEARGIALPKDLDIEPAAHAEEYQLVSHASVVTVDEQEVIDDIIKDLLFKFAKIDLEENKAERTHKVIILLKVSAALNAVDSSAYAFIRIRLALKRDIKSMLLNTIHSFEVHDIIFFYSHILPEMDLDVKISILKDDWYKFLDRSKIDLDNQFTIIRRLVLNLEEQEATDLFNAVADTSMRLAEMILRSCYQLEITLDLSVEQLEKILNILNDCRDPNEKAEMTRTIFHIAFLPQRIYKPHAPNADDKYSVMINVKSRSESLIYFRRNRITAESVLNWGKILINQMLFDPEFLAETSRFLEDEGSLYFDNFIIDAVADPEFMQHWIQNMTTDQLLPMVKIAGYASRSNTGLATFQRALQEVALNFCANIENAPENSIADFSALLDYLHAGNHSPFCFEKSLLRNVLANLMQRANVAADEFSDRDILAKLGLDKYKYGIPYAAAQTLQFCSRANCARIDAALQRKVAQAAVYAMVTISDMSTPRPTPFT